MSTAALERTPLSRRVGSADALRVALFCDSYPPQINGVALLLERLVKAIRERGGAVRVFTTTDPEGGVAASVRRWASVPLWFYPEHRISLPTQPRVRRELRAWRPTLVHAASPFGLGLAGRAAARALGLPFVSSYHTSWSAYSQFYQLGVFQQAAWRYLRWFHNGGVRTYCPTHAVERELMAHGFDNTEIWSRGVDSSRFNPSYRSTALRARLGVPDDGLLAIYVGRLGAEKGLEVALRALHRVQRAQPGRIWFALGGDGPYREEAERHAPPQTTFLGRLTGRDLSELYASADLFVFPSATDTFGNVLLEAMASGLPVVGADVGPTRELLAERTGVTFPAGDAAAMAAAILDLAGAPERRLTMARRGIAFARRCTWDRVFDDLIADYLSVQHTVARHRGTSAA
jgi:glycosyltransferase involved in cell wall biosynthesis